MPDRCPVPEKGCITCERRARPQDWPRATRKLPPPEDFPECLLELRRKFQTSDPDKASELLADAESAYAEVEARVAGVQQRASALQGAVAIAATVALAGGGLILDRSILDADGWRIAFATLLLALVASLAISGYFALNASSRPFWTLTPSDVENVYERMELPLAEAKSWRAAYLFQAYGHNNQIAELRWKYLGWARRAFNVSLVMLGLVMALIVALVISAA